MDDVRKMSGKQLLKEFSEDSECSTEFGGEVRAELLRRLDAPAGRFGEALRQIVACLEADIAPDIRIDNALEIAEIALESDSSAALPASQQEEHGAIDSRRD